MMRRSRREKGSESGQAAVEAALTLPLVLFLVLGTLQLFLMMHARILTQYAAYRATRAGSVNHGNCQRMVHAALLAVMPSIESFAKPNGNSAAVNLAAAFRRRINNRFNERVSDGGNLNMYTGDIIWIAREQPKRAVVTSYGDMNNDFDEPDNPLMRLEVRLVYWYPMRIPFANWVMSKIFLVNFRLATYAAQNPLMIRQTADWNGTNSGSTYSLDAEIAAEMLTRAARKEYVFPISANYTMRMMTPAKAVNFRTQNCPPTPETL